MKYPSLTLMFAGVAIALFQPLVAYGTARWGAGYGDLLNGGLGLGLGLMILGGVMAVVALRRQRRAGGGK